ncbi:protein mono-ADP-ribosyltransferase PARP12-like [Rhinophrynus dorsalis]
MESETKAIAARVQKLLCSSGGSMHLGHLTRVSGLSAEQVERLVAEELGISLMSKMVTGEKVLVSRSAVRLCADQIRGCKGDCRKLHLCRYHVFESCSRDPCAFSHDIQSGHNLTVLQMYELEQLSIDELRQLLLQNDPSLLPEVCKHYNQGNGIYGSCTFKMECQKLHICQYFLDKNCRYDLKCRRSHDLDDIQNMKKLMKWGVGSKLVPSLPQTYWNASALRDCRAPLPKNAGTSGKKGIPLASSSHQSPSPLDHSDEICLYYIKKSCSFGNQCSKHHYYLSYRWQVQKMSDWQDMEDMESIEQAYCDVNRECLTPFKSWSMDINFDTMTYKSFKVRRLSTPSSASKLPYFILTTDWFWYWKDEYNRWIEYGKEENLHKAAELSSDDVEKAYLSDRGATLQFKVGTEAYELRLKDMVQKNLALGTERKVCRRPRFVSVEEAKRKSRKPESSLEDTKNFPLHWDMEQLPDVGYKLVSLDKASDEYNKVKDLFHNTLRTVSIHSIERIQNPSLWEVYQWQKEQMKKKNGGKDVDERQLFHGTSDKLTDAICQQNLDWRICGLHGSMYGKGSYFARDASYSHTYSTQSFSQVRAMFLARVLVGDFTAGNSSYLRPPAKQLSSSGLYDSCVDVVLNPSIFIIFEKHQIYPEYLIKYI